MNILLVEDDPEYAADVQEALRSAGVTVHLAQSRDSALRLVHRVKFDLIICDLDIPPEDGALDSDTDHGDIVRAEVEAELPGTPVIVHSAYGTLEYLAERMDNARTHDLYGTNQEVPLLSFVQKDDTPELIRRIEEAQDHLRALADIEVDIGGSDEPLPAEHRRVLQIFARRVGGRLVRLTDLSGGLSSARVLRALVRNNHGGQVAAVVGKIDTLESVEAEHRAYHEFVAPLMGVGGGFAPLADRVFAGAGQIGGLFYNVAEEYNRSLFDVIREAPETAEVIVRRLPELTDRWVSDAPTTTVAVGEVRRRLLSDEKLAEVDIPGDLDLEVFENRPVQIKECTQHRDLHGLNLLVDPNGEPVVIDYGEVGMGPGTLDPVTLELSLIFHPEGRPLLPQEWPRIEQARNWLDLEVFSEECPVPGFIRACREWSTGIGPASRAVLVSAYSYVLRQMTYNDTPKDIGWAVLRNVLDRWG